jgi:hypothetical protein
MDFCAAGVTQRCESARLSEISRVTSGTEQTRQVRRRGRTCGSGALRILNRGLSRPWRRPFTALWLSNYPARWTVAGPSPERRCIPRIPAGPVAFGWPSHSWSSFFGRAIIVFGSSNAAADRPDPSDQAEMAKGLFDGLTLFWRARDDATTTTSAVRLAASGQTSEHLDMSDPRGLRNEAMLTLNELLYLAVGRHANPPRRAFYPSRNNSRNSRESGNWTRVCSNRGRHGDSRALS